MGRQEHTNPFFPTEWMSALTNKLVAMKSHVIHFFHPAKDKVNSPADKQDQKKSLLYISLFSKKDILLGNKTK